MKPVPGSIDSHFYSSVIFIFIQYFCNYYLCVQILTLINYSLWIKIQFGCSISIGLLSCRK